MVTRAELGDASLVTRPDALSWSFFPFCPPPFRNCILGCMKLSVQLYTVRDDMERDMWGTLAALKSMGLNYVEIGGSYGKTPQELKAGLDKSGLKVSANHIPIPELENNLNRVIEDNRILENDVIVVPHIGRDRYEKGWGVVGKGLEEIGKKLHEAGFTLAYHNHDFEFGLQNGRPGLDQLYEAADPRYLTAQLDTYWVAYGGADPAEYIRKLTGRVAQCHFKDGKLGEGEPHFLEVGHGDLNWDSILAACRETNVPVGSIELDFCPREPLESVRMSVEFLRTHGVSE